MLNKHYEAYSLRNGRAYYPWRTRITADEKEYYGKEPQSITVSPNSQVNSDINVDNGQNGGIIKGEDGREIKGFPEYVDTYNKIVKFNQEIATYDLDKENDLKKYHDGLDKLVNEVKSLPFIEKLNHESNIRTQKYTDLPTVDITADNESMQKSWEQNHSLSLRDDKKVLKEKKIFIFTGHPAMFKSSIFVDKISKDYGYS